jgi:hypothetical protein
MEFNIFNYKITPNMMYVIILIIYISVISIYTPRPWLSLINHPYIKFTILLFIFYTICFDEDLMLGIFMLVAFVVTINMDNSIQAAKELYKSELLINESFENNNNKKDSDDVVNDEEDNEKYENIMTDKTLKDTFSVLHESIHELQKMVDNKNAQYNKKPQ